MLTKTCYLDFTGFNHTLKWLTSVVNMQYCAWSKHCVSQNTQAFCIMARGPSSWRNLPSSYHTWIHRNPGSVAVHRWPRFLNVGFGLHPWQHGHHGTWAVSQGCKLKPESFNSKSGWCIIMYNLYNLQLASLSVINSDNEAWEGSFRHASTMPDNIFNPSFQNTFACTDQRQHGMTRIQ